MHNHIDRKGDIKVAKSGDVFEHPVTKERIVVLKTAGDTGGELFQMELTLQPGGFVAGEHIHPLQDERFEVISGSLRGSIAGKEWSAEPGDTRVVQTGTPHVWWNAGDEDLRVLVDFRPALRTEEFFETFFGLAQDGKVSRKTGLPNLLQLAVVAREHRNEIVSTRPPRLVQTVLFGVLAPIGRLLGYKTKYPYPRPTRAQEQVQLQTT
jgi:quercetin dioxygenase-like cupin family protein